jgi:toxin-antitoxin system PIN domain toxin
MKYLLDVNMLLAGIWKDHAQHAVASAWLSGKSLVVCPVTELGFIRISTNPRAINSSMEKARDFLEKFHLQRQTEFVPDDLPALKSNPKTSGQVTDHYLAALAEKHGLKLATLDAGLKHPAVELVF